MKTLRLKTMPQDSSVLFRTRYYKELKIDLIVEKVLRRYNDWRRLYKLPNRR